MEVINIVPGEGVYSNTLDTDVHPVHTRLQVYAWFGNRKREIFSATSDTSVIILSPARCTLLAKHCKRLPNNYVILRLRQSGRLPAEDVCQVNNILMGRILGGLDVFFDNKFHVRLHADGLHVSHVLVSAGAPYDRNLIL